MRVGFIGLGIMGSRMAASLRRAGHDLTVYNRTRATAETWAAEHGATVAATPAEAGAAADVVITMVVDGDQVRDVLLGPGGVAEGAAPGTLCVDMSTIAPSETRAIGAELAEHGLSLLDAPVTGSAPRAEDGTLTIMAGGEREDFERAKPLLEAMGALVLHVGPLGQGEMLKLVNNAVAAANAATLAQALVVAKATGVDLKALVAVMGAGSGGSTMLTLKAGPMLEHDYTTLFKLEHMLKDVRLCLEEGQTAGVPFPVAAATREALSAAMGRGHADDDFAAVLEAFEGLAGVRL
ncbi:MAG: 6-phosphogluconate dehydrogenase NAD-binding protein [Solirubrobacterales bacterium]|jgi:3-hydroxyisobutyrate dehydrogenase-like beta-hydroxyacid dehydrogenase|nr:6-phosphogluconate dehydrogenase NAD-binding protein [Solirubrobacterales bacterium]